MNATRVRDDRPPPSAWETLLQMVISYAKEAVALDTKRQYEVAVRKYTRAAEFLLDLLKVNRNPKLQRLCVEKVQEYIARAKYLAQCSKPEVSR